MNDNSLSWLKPYPHIHKTTNALLSVWPAHRRYVDSRFRDDDEEFLRRTDEMTQLALLLIGKDLELYCKDYQWMCKIFVEEQFYFKRHGKYRLKTFEEARSQVYADREYMSRYIRGLLISQIIWKNHAQAIDIFRTQFLPDNIDNYNYLEIGPGHGLFFYFAANDVRHASITGWDISESSIEATNLAMRAFDISGDKYNLCRQDVLDIPDRMRQYESVTISEVLEHLEAPGQALKSLRKSMRHQARIFINIPVNSPAPDHLYLWKNTEDVVEFVKSCGFEIEQEHYFPANGISIERAKAMSVDISCIIIARKN